MTFKEVKRIALVLAFGLLAPMLDTTMTNIAINDISRDLGTTLDSVQWIITAYVLATSVSVPFSGWLSQRFNGKYVFFIAQVLFGLSSVGAALSTTINGLILARVVQGFAAGLIIPLVTNMLVNIAPKSNFNKLMMIVMLPIMVGPIFGPILGAIVVTYGNWQWIFWINVPIMLVAATFNLWMVPNMSGLNPTAKIDWLGIVLLGIGSTSIIYGISQAGKVANFDNANTLVYCGLGILILLFYVVWAIFKGQQAVLPIGLFKSPIYSATIVNLILAGIITTGPMLLLPLYFQQGRGLSILATGLWLLPQGIGMLAIRPVLVSMLSQIGSRYVVLFSLTLTLFGTLPFFLINAQTNIILVSFVLFIRGLGVGGVIMPLMTVILTGMDKKLVSQANVGARIFQNLGGAFGSALVATIVAAYLSSHQIVGAHVMAYQHAFLWSAMLTIVMVVPTLFLPSKFTD